MRRRRVSQHAGGRISRRRFLGSVITAGLYLNHNVSTASETPPDKPNEYWWHRFPSFIQTKDPTLFRDSGARMVIHGSAKDPTWGPFGQLTSRIESAASLKAIKSQGGRAITWIEGFGDCMLYVAAFNRFEDGSLEARPEDTLLPKVFRSHWDWADPRAPAGNAIRWVGIHNLVDDEDFCRKLNKRIGFLRNPPTYPDGKPALGTIPGRIYPLNHRVYDACGSKNLNGDLNPNFEGPENVNTPDPVTGEPHGPVEGLYPAVYGEDDVSPIAGAKPAHIVYCGVISVHIDLSAPFWREYVRKSIFEIIHAGLDGVWCDNYSPWDNFGYPPLHKAFGDWSVARAEKHYWDALHAPEVIVFGDIKPLNLREYLKMAAVGFGAKNSTDLADPAWCDKRWMDDPIWNMFKAVRQSAAKHDLHEFYDAIHDEATRMGRPDFCIGGNDVPLYGLGWVRDTWQDMINTETTPGWHMGAGSRGIMIPPLGKMAIMYRAALEHQKGPFSAAWYYLNGGYERYQQKPEIGKVLSAEAFANGAFLMCMPDNKQVSGTLESHSWWNRFVRENEERFGNREPYAEVGVLFSPDNQLFQMAPGGYPDIDDQPHIFGHYGWATACIDAHYPYRAITDWKLVPNEIEQLKQLILPHAASLTLAATEALSDWAKAGGHLILTGDAGSRWDGTNDFNLRDSYYNFANKLGVNRPTSGDISMPHGKGRITWIADNLGSNYYLQHTRRAELLAAMVKQLGDNLLVRPGNLPSTVGVFLWRSADHKQIFADLVNYDLDADRDVVRPINNLSFSIHTPVDWMKMHIETISPDKSATAMVEETYGCLVKVRLPVLHYFASVKLSGYTTL